MQSLDKTGKRLNGICCCTHHVHQIPHALHTAWCQQTHRAVFSTASVQVCQYTASRKCNCIMCAVALHPCRWTHERIHEIRVLSPDEQLQHSSARTHVINYSIPTQHVPLVVSPLASWEQQACDAMHRSVVRNTCIHVTVHPVAELPQLVRGNILLRCM